MTNRLHYLLQLHEASPKDAFVLFALAKEYEGNLDDAQALSFYLRLREADPAYVGLYYHLGKLYERLEDIQNAIDTFKQGIETSRLAGDRHAMSELQGALMNISDLDEQ